MSNPIFFILAFSISTLSLYLLAVSYNTRKRKVRQLANLELLHNMRQLLSLIQQHRGFSTGFLHGNESVLNNIDRLHSLAEKHIKAIDGATHYVEISERWESITEHWSRLSVNYKNLRAENNMLQHNTLIRSFLFLMDDIEHAHDMQILKKYLNTDQQFLWQDLLYASEYIGQSRALGMGASSEGNCSSATRINLNYLCNKITDKTQTVWLNTPPSAQQRACIDKLLQSLNQDIMQEKITIRANDFFDIASAALNSLHTQYDQLVISTQKHINKHHFFQ